MKYLNLKENNLSHYMFNFAKVKVKWYAIRG